MPDMLFQNKCLHLLLVFVLLAGVLACQRKEQNSPPGYSLNKPERSDLGKVLNEISGLFYSAEDSSLLAVADSKEKIFQINLKTKKLQDYTEKIIASDSDVEDI